MRRIFFYMLALVFLSGIGFAQTTATVSGHISAPNTVATTSQTQVIFELTNTGGQLCKVSGTTLVMPYFQTFSPQQILAGVTLYRNDAISCGTTTGGSRWKYTIKYGSASPNASVPQSVSCVLNIASSSINLDSTACLNAAPTPVVAVPTDALYARLDGTNAGFTGDLTFNGHNLSGLGNVSVGGTLGASGGGTLSGGFTGTFTSLINTGTEDGSKTGTLINWKTINNYVYADAFKVGSTTCGIAEANTFVSTMGGLNNSVVVLPFGLCTATTTIPLQDGVVYRGYGGKSPTNSLNQCATLIKNATTDIFTYSGTHSAFELSDLCAWSAAGGGHIVTLSATTIRIRIHDFVFVQDNAAKGGIVSTTNTNNFVGNRIFNGLFVYTVAPTTSVINIVSTALAADTFENLWFQTSTAGTTTAPTLLLNDNGVNTCSLEIVLRGLQFEPPGAGSSYAGAIQTNGVCGLLIDSAQVDATGYTATGPAISITPVATLPNKIASPITIIGSSSFGGTTTQPDLLIAQTVPSLITMTGNNFAWVAGNSGQPFSYFDVNNNIVNQHDTNQSHAPATIYLSSVYTNATTTFSTVTGMSWPIPANGTYSLTCQIQWQGSANTAGPKFQLTGPVSPTEVTLNLNSAVTATTTIYASDLHGSFSNTVANSGTISTATNLPLTFTAGVLNGTTAGTLTLQAAANGAGTLTIQPGSFCALQ